MLQLTAGFHQHGCTSGSRRGKTTDRENERRSAEEVTDLGLGLQDSISEISLQAHDTSATKDISRFLALKITCLCVNTRFTAFEVSRASRYHRRGGKAGGKGGELVQPYVPEDRLAGGAHQSVAEGLGVGVVQILDGPAPRFGLVQEAILPILLPLKIQPGRRTRTGQTSRHRGGTR